jgi:hypothetical protein
MILSRNVFRERLWARRVRVSAEFHGARARRAVATIPGFCSFPTTVRSVDAVSGSRKPPIARTIALRTRASVSGSVDFSAANASGEAAFLRVSAALIRTA